MTSYSKATNFATKDTLLTGNPSKVVKGTEIDAEFTALQAADADNLKISDLGTGVETALGVNIGSAGAPVLFNGAAGTPTSGTLTNCTGLPSTGFTFLQAGTGATSRTGQAKLRDVVSVKDYGAVGDGTTDDTAAIQAAIDANSERCIMFPTGTYKITTTLTVSSAGTRLVGESSGGGGGSTVGSVILNTGAGDAVYFVNTGGAGTSLHGCGMENITVTRTSHIATGSGIHLKDTSTFVLSNVNVSEHLYCYELEDAQNTKFDLFSAYTGNAFTGASGSALLYIHPLSTFAGAAVDAGWTNTFTNFQLTSANISEYSIYIAGGDAMLFSTGYCGDADVEHVRIKGAAGVPLYTVVFDNMYFDGVRVDGTGTPIGIRHISDGDAGTGSVDIRMSGCTFGQLNTSIYIDEPQATTVVIDGNEFHNNRDGAIYISSASSVVSITGNSFKDTGTAVANSGAISVDSCSSLSITGNNFSSLNLGTNKAVKLSGTIGILAISGNVFDTCDNDLTNTATISKSVISGNSSSNSTNTIMGFQPGNVANSDSTFLDWYQEGSWTPAIAFGGASVGVTYTTRIASYTRVGNRVFFDAYILLSSKGSSTGVVTITGFPYNLNASNVPAFTVRLDGYDAASNVIGLIGGQTSTTDVGLYSSATGVSTQLTDAAITNTTNILISGQYRVA